MTKRPRHNEKTGFIRFRQTIRGKLILQVEVWDSKWLGEVVWFKRWRDAELHDIYTATFVGNSASQVLLRKPDDD